MSCCCDIAKIPVVKGDFRVLFKVNEPTLPEGWTLTKMNIQIGDLMKSYNEPTFPFEVSLTSQETLNLKNGANDVSILLFNGTNPKTACLDKAIQVFAIPQKVKQ